ncbi:MAG: 2-C-methyl-D-erythritol 4-phosphate cytidylyltransferase [Colwellia sp.]|nr:2-C-methyl-D-erythritol 4-phosphate cytidylyltransferase [Colwellia sp.]
MTNAKRSFIVVVPAAGIGKRMHSQCPKQYLTIDNLTIIEHTVIRLLSHEAIDKVVIALGENDEYFADTSLAKNTKVSIVVGGKERVDSVLSALKSIDKNQYPWVLVHDAARPCITHRDISALIEKTLAINTGGLLAMPVRDTMKRGKREEQQSLVEQTVERSELWHALTPQMYRSDELQSAIEQALSMNVNITDESSAMENAGFESILVEGSGDNIKITRPDDLALAEFILTKQKTKNND